MTKDDIILSINKKSVLGNDGKCMMRMLNKSGSSVEIGAVRPKKTWSNACKQSYE